MVSRFIEERPRQQGRPDEGNINAGTVHFVQEGIHISQRRGNADSFTASAPRRSPAIARCGFHPAFITSSPHSSAATTFRPDSHPLIFLTMAITRFLVWTH